MTMRRRAIFIESARCSHFMQMPMIIDIANMPLDFSLSYAVIDARAMLPPRVPLAADAFIMMRL